MENERLRKEIKRVTTHVKTIRGHFLKVNVLLLNIL